MAFWAGSEGEILGVMLFGFVAAAFSYGLFLSIRLRLSLRAGSMGIVWNATSRMNAEGYWPREAIEGLRFLKGERFYRPPGRSFWTELRVQGQWVALTRSHREKRGFRLAEDLGHALGLGLHVVDADPGD